MRPLDRTPRRETPSRADTRPAAAASTPAPSTRAPSRAALLGVAWVGVAWLAAGCGGAAEEGSGVGREASVPSVSADPDAAEPIPPRAARDPELADPIALYGTRDYFRLRESLGDPEAAAGEEATGGRRDGRSPRGVDDAAAVRDAFLRAVVANAFNRPERSNALLEGILDGRAALPDSLAARARELRIANHLRLHRYADALASARELASNPAGMEAGELDEVRNTMRILAALADVPPQETTFGGTTALRLVEGRVPVRFGDSTRRYAFDTGANLSVLMRSEAESLGLDVRPAGITVGTSTDVKLEADVTVAPEMAIGAVGYRNVVFLVFPDEALTFPGGLRIPGLLGFPVIEAMGELRFRGDSVEVPASPPARPFGSLALDGLDILVRVRFRDDLLLCRLDTGANRTAFYRPFYERYERLVEERGRRDTARTGGVGGVREIPVYELEEVEVEVAGATAELGRVHVYTRALFDDEKDEYLFCNVGLDLFDRFSERILDFRSMALVLR